MPVTADTLAESVTDSSSGKLVDALIDNTKHELPPITPEMLSAMEWFDDSVGNIFQAYDYADIIGVVAGIKPATVVNLDTLVGSSLTERDAVALLADMGLEVQSHINTFGYRLLAVSRHSAINNLLVDSLYIKTRTAQQTVGRCLGYPTTATEFYIRRTLESDAGSKPPAPDIPLDPRGGNFTQLILSPEHYEEEIQAYSEPLRRAVEVMAPNTYRIITASQN